MNERSIIVTPKERMNQLNIADLYELAEYGDFKEEMLHDRLVVGIRDLAQMQTEAGLTLEKAKTMIRQKEAAKEHQREIQRDSEAYVNRLSSGGNSQGDFRLRCRQQSDRQPSHGPQCTRCGDAKHAAGDRCPAMGATCHKCNRKGHFSAQCFLKTVAVVSGAVRKTSVKVNQRS